MIFPKETFLIDPNRILTIYSEMLAQVQQIRPGYMEFD